MSEIWTRWSFISYVQKLGCPHNYFLGKPKFKIWRKIQRILVNKFGASRNNFAKLAHMVCREIGMKIGVQFLEACTLIISRRINLRDFGLLYTLIAKISPEQIKISTSGKQR